MKTLILAAIRCSLMFTAVTASLFCDRPAEAYTVTLKQMGANVVATGSGPINLTGLGLPGIILSDPNAAIFPSQGAIATGPASGPVVQIDVYNFAASGPTSFGSGPGGFANTGTGDPYVGIQPDVPGTFAIFLPHGYTSGAALSDSMTFNNATFASLGLTPGTYVWSWGDGANQRFTLRIGAVPDGGSTVSLLGFGLLGLVALRRRLRC